MKKIGVFLFREKSMRTCLKQPVFSISWHFKRIYVEYWFRNHKRLRQSSALTATQTKQSAGKFAPANLFLHFSLIGGKCNTRCLNQSASWINSPTSESVLIQVSTWYFCEPDIQEHWERRNAPRRRRTKTGWRDWEQASTVKRVSAKKRGLKIFQSHNKTKLLHVVDT